jgi:RimJ/RimL family protein N-acetyltransferase
LQQLAAPAFEGRLVSLRFVEPEDWPTFAEHERDSASTRLGAGWAPVPWSSHRLKSWAEAPERSKVVDDAFTLAIVRNAGAELVGSINTHHCDRRAGTFSYGVMVWPEYRRAGLASEAVRLVLGWAFGEARYQKCDVTIYEFNEASLELHRRLGFTMEGRRRRAVYTAGEHFDEFLFGMTSEEFRASSRRGRG